MPKIKKIKELKPKIKEVENSEEESELVEDIEEAEESFDEGMINSSNFRAPSLVLESNAPQTPTQIQQETQQRRAVGERNTAMRRAVGETTDYAARREDSGYRQYTQTATPADSLRENRGIIRQPTAQALNRHALPQGNAIQRAEERKEQYQAGKTKKKIYPWEA